jgi:hypothetical protein
VLYNDRFAGFNSHARLEGSHAFLSPSNYHWLNYPDEKLIERLRTVEAAARGTELHEVAARCIKHGIRLDPFQEDHDTLALYVNESLEFGMRPEQTLFYSFNCYGTADAIGFNPDLAFLRIHDLKTGVSKASEMQLYIYAGLFCLEYEYRPFEIDGELRIYQNGESFVYPIDAERLAFVYDRIQTAHRVIEAKRNGGMR